MDALANVYEGNAASHKDLIEAFKGKRGHLFYSRKKDYKTEKFKLDPLKGTGIKGDLQRSTVFRWGFGPTGNARRRHLKR